MNSHLVFELILLVLELAACLSVAVLEGLVHRIHDVLQLAHLEAMLGTDERSLRLKLIDQGALFLAELHPQLLDALTL